jgi:hypothetical protein
MYCKQCGKQAAPSLKFCSHCGVARPTWIHEYAHQMSTLPYQAHAQTITAIVPTVTSLTQEQATIYQRLKAFKEEREVHCRECGYLGPMGVVKAIPPWWNRWFIWIPLALTGIGFFAFLAYCIIGSLNTRHRVVCPQCLRTLDTK